MGMILDLRHPDAGRVDLCGGKAAGLAKLVHWGFDVPDALIVTVEAYRQVAESLPGGVVTWAALNDIALPEPVLRALRDFVRDDVAYAVRSSATLEDLGEASFAGQHDTVLGCIGLSAIEDAIRTCYASAYDERAVAYRRHHGIDETPAMAVLVQQMVNARAAGVAFTLDPINGKLDEIHLSAHSGLGEAVVGGEAEVDRFILNKADLTIRDTAFPRGAPCLTESEAAAIAAIARAVEEKAGFPQDVEWAVEGTGVRVLQARPVTALPPRWTRDESAERFPSPVTPLAWDFAEAGFHEALSSSFARMGLPPLRAKWFGRFDGFIYGNQTAVEIYLSRMPMPSGPSLEAVLPELVRRFGWLLELPGEWERSLDRFLLDVGRLRAQPLDALPAAAIWAHVGEINRAGRAYFRHNIAISIGQTAIHKALRALLQTLTHDADAAYDTLMAPVRTRTAHVNDALEQLAAIARNDAILSHALREQGAAELIARGTLTGFPVFHTAWTALLDEHGHRELDFDPYQPGWAEAPDAALEAVRARLDRPATPRDTLADRIAAERTLRRLSASLPDDTALLLGELVRLARLYTELDDVEHYHTARLAPLLRRAIGTLGRHPAEIGAIEAPLDLFFASEASLAEAVARDDASGWHALGRKIADAKECHAEQTLASPPWTLDETRDDTVSDDALSGIPGSPGRAEGPAFILRSPADFGVCPDGAILVVRATTPAWTAIFARAAGIVAESGGPLSHGAIAAREHGIPAVMAVRGAMTTLRNGQRVRIDGRSGVVTALDA